MSWVQQLVVLKGMDWRLELLLELWLAFQMEKMALNAISWVQQLVVLKKMGWGLELLLELWLALQKDVKVMGLGQRDSRRLHNRL